MAEGHQDLKQPGDGVPKTEATATWAVVRGAYMLDMVVSGTHFTCFTGTKVTAAATWAVVRGAYLLHVVLSGTHFTCFTVTRVQILTLLLKY